MKKYLKSLSAPMMALFFATTINGCATHSRSFEEPIENQYRTKVEWKEERVRWKLSYREETDHYIYAGFLQDYQKDVVRQQQVERHYLAGADSDCAEMVIATFGILLPIDFLIYALQFGTDDTMCFAQVIDTDPSIGWNDGYSTGEHYEYSKPYTNYIKFYQGKNSVAATNEGNGLWSIRKVDMPEGASIYNVYLKNGNVYFN